MIGPCSLPVMRTWHCKTSHNEEEIRLRLNFDSTTLERWARQRHSPETYVFDLLAVLAMKGRPRHICTQDSFGSTAMPPWSVLQLLPRALLQAEDMWAHRVLKSDGTVYRSPDLCCLSVVVVK